MVRDADQRCGVPRTKSRCRRTCGTPRTGDARAAMSFYEQALLENYLPQQTRLFGQANGRYSVGRVQAQALRDSKERAAESLSA